MFLEPTLRMRTAPVVMLLITFVGLPIHVTILPLLLRASYRDAWVACCIGATFLVLWVILLHQITTFMALQPMDTWLKSTGGRWVTRILHPLILIQLYVVSLLTLVDTVNWIKTIVLINTPQLILIACLLLVCLYAALSGIATIAIANGIILPFIIIFGFFAGISNLPNKDFSLLLPILDHGMHPVWQGIFFAVAGYSELIIVLWMQPMLQSPISLRIFLLLAGILIIIALGPLLAAIAEFGPYESASQNYPAFEEWRLVGFGHTIEHVDFLAMYQWLSSAFIRISLALYFLFHFSSLHSFKRKVIGIPLIIGSIIMIVSSASLLIKSFEFVYWFYALVSSIIVTIILFIWGLIHRSSSIKEST